MTDRLTSAGRNGRRIAVGTILVAALCAGVALAEPVPGYDASSFTPTVGQEVTFTAQDACLAPVECTWDFGDGSPADSGQVVKHAFGAVGPVTVTLTADDTSDPDGAVVTSRGLLVEPAILPNRPPDAVAEAVPTNPLTGQAVQFDSSGSTDADGDALSHDWDLDGDGSFETLGQARPSRAYAAAGAVTVSVRVSDGRATSNAFITITVRNRPPTVTIARAPQAPFSDDQVRFTASAADPDGTITRYAWDLDDDGGFDDATAATARSRFAIPGNHDVSVRVTDDGGATGRATVRVRVGNRAPTAAFSYAPDPVVKRRPVTFTARARDPEGRLGKLQWDFNHDGRYDAEGATVTKTFPIAQSRIDVKLKVSDRDGGSAVATSVITPGNLSPTATVSASLASPLSGERVTFTADASDADGQVTYAWDLDNDGGFDDGAGPAVTRAFAIPGKAVVRLRVTDDAGASLTVEREVVVRARPSAASGEPGASPIGAPARARPRLLTPFPVIRFAGTLNPGGARLSLFTVKAPKGARISVRCRGAGCPRPSRTRAGGVKRLRALQRTYRAGVRIEIRVTKPHRIGKHVRITIRKGRAPARKDACLWPGSRAPRACP